MKYQVNGPNGMIGKWDTHAEAMKAAMSAARSRCRAFAFDYSIPIKWVRAKAIGRHKVCCQSFHQVARTWCTQFNYFILLK